MISLPSTLVGAHFLDPAAIALVQHLRREVPISSPNGEETGTLVQVDDEDFGAKSCPPLSRWSSVHDQAHEK